MHEFIKSFATVAATTVAVLGGIYVGARVTGAAIAATEWTEEKVKSGVDGFRANRAEKKAAAPQAQAA